MPQRIALFFVALAVIVALVGIAAYDALHRPGPLTQAATVVIPKGANVAQIAALLKRHQVIASPLFFQLAVRADSRGGSLRAGEYAFGSRVNLRGVVAEVRAGRTVVRKLTVPEGLTSPEVVRLLEGAPALDGEISTRPAEGSLLPETYYYSYGDDREALLARMAAAMKEAVRTLWSKRAADLPLKSPDEAVILASIVEKETSRPEERARIAAVFLNRLRLGMRLQADPTVAYAVATSHDAHAGDGRSLTAADLQMDSPYNTYQKDGLPPGPIANPGRASIAAVLWPAVSEDLYFVADGTGGHAFAQSLDEHNKNVMRWRRLQRVTSP